MFAARRRILVQMRALAIAAAAVLFCASSSAGADTACTPRLGHRVTLPGHPMDVARSGDTLWVALAGVHDARTGETLRAGSAVAVDARTGRIVRRLRLPVDPTEIVSAFGSLWVIGAAVERRDQGVLRIDPGSGGVIAVIKASRAYGSRIGATTTAIWVGGADVFAPGHSGQAGVRFVYKIDPRRNGVVRRVQLPGGMTVLHLEHEGSSLWVSGWWGVARISDAGRVLFQARFAGAGWSMARVPGAVWVAVPWSGTPYRRRQDRAHEARRLLRVDTSGRRPRMTQIALERQPGGLAAAGGPVWMGDLHGLSQVGLAAVASVALDVHPTAMVASPGVVWAAELTTGRLIEVAC
jgi:hypothetical protein